MDHAQTMSTNAVMGSASLYSMPVMTMMTVETSQMSLAAVSTLRKSVKRLDEFQKKPTSDLSQKQIIRQSLCPRSS